MDVSAARLESTDYFRAVHIMKIISCCLVVFVFIIIFIHPSQSVTTYVFCRVSFSFILTQHPERTTELKGTDSAVV